MKSTPIREELQLISTDEICLHNSSVTKTWTDNDTIMSNKPNQQTTVAVVNYAGKMGVYLMHSKCLNRVP